MAEPEKLTMTRRGVLLTGAAIATSPLLSVSAPEVKNPAGIQRAPSNLLPVSFEVNGLVREIELDPRTTLLDALREHLHLTGSKKGCDHGQCGACTVLVDGIRINACLTLAIMHAGQSITTIEGLGTPTNLHPLQASFIKHDGFQCGYCTPGQICSAVGMMDEIKRNIPSHASVDLSESNALTLDEVQERMSGNLCRCGAYANITTAIMDVAGGDS